MTDWTQLLEQASPHVRLRAPATRQAIREAETGLGHPLPEQLAELLEQTDGFHQADAHYDPCWPLARLVDENLRIRRDDLMPQADRKLYIGDNGAGQPFFVATDDFAAWDEDVLVWSRIDGEAQRLAPNLADFWQGWLSGAISS